MLLTYYQKSVYLWLIAWSELWKTLLAIQTLSKATLSGTGKKKKTLKLIVSTDGKEIFYANAIQSVDLKSGSQITMALEVLIKKDIVYKNKDYQIQDVMFKKWIQALL